MELTEVFRHRNGAFAFVVLGYILLYTHEIGIATDQRHDTGREQPVEPKKAQRGESHRLVGINRSINRQSYVSLNCFIHEEASGLFGVVTVPPKGRYNKENKGAG